MNSPILTKFFLVMVGVLSLLFSGCGAPSPPVTFYNLTPVDKALSQTAASTPTALAVGVGPVVFPDSLSRAQMAVRIDNQRLKFDEFHRWSGSLAKDFSNVLIEDLAGQLPKSTQLASYPWGKYFQPTQRVQVDVRRFDGSLGGQVVLEARWVVTDGEGKKMLASNKSLIKIESTGSDFSNLVSAQSQAVSQLALEIAGALVSQ